MYTVTDRGVLKKVETWSVIVPLHDNDGVAFDKEIVDQVLEEILLDYPGFSVTNTIGYWKGSDQTYVDKNYQILIDAVPNGSSDSSAFFVELKESLQRRLKQEKIYVTKQDSKEELLTFNEFFLEMGLLVTAEDPHNQAKSVVQTLAANFAFVEQRLGYETLLLRRDVSREKVIWERKLCGITLRSEFNDTLPTNINIVAADQYDRLGAALLGEHPVAIIGSYEFLLYTLDRTNPRCLIEVDRFDFTKYSDPYTRSPSGKLIDVKTFIEEFTAGVFIGCLVLREEGFLPKELTVNVGADGSMQRGANDARSMLLVSPAVIPEIAVQQKIIECLGQALEAYEKNSIVPIALAQAKAKNGYFLKRSIVRHAMKHGDAD